MLGAAQWDREPPHPRCPQGRELARGRAWCRGHCARLSLLNGAVVPGASRDPSTGSHSGSSLGMATMQQELPVPCHLGTPMVVEGSISMSPSTPQVLAAE